MIHLDARIQTNVTVSYNYGGYTICFRKTFQFPFTPFYGMSIAERHDEAEHDIRVENSPDTFSIIGFVPSARSYDEEYFYINIEKDIDLYPVIGRVTPDDIDYILELFDKTGWERVDSENVDELKKSIYD